MPKSRLPKKLTVCLDVDGVLADFVGHTLAALYDGFGIRVRHHEIEIWDILAIPAVAPYAAAVKAMWAEPGFCKEIPVISGSLKAVYDLQAVAVVRYATAPMADSPHWVPERLSWLQDIFGTRKADIVFTADKWEVPAHVFVDDNAENVIRYADRHPGARVFLRNQPYNVNAYLANPGIHRIDNLMEIVSEVEAMSKTWGQ